MCSENHRYAVCARLVLQYPEGIVRFVDCFVTYTEIKANHHQFVRIFVCF